MDERDDTARAEGAAAGRQLAETFRQAIDRGTKVAFGGAELRIAAAAESIADSLAALLKLQLVQANLTRAQLDAAEEAPAAGTPDPAAELGTLERAAAAKRGGAGVQPDATMDLLAQTEEEMERILVAHELAEQYFGRDKIPSDLDLYAYAEEAGVDQVIEQRKNPVAEPYSTVSPKPAGPEDEPDDTGWDMGGGVPV